MSVAIGGFSGQYTQGINAVAIGYQAGNSNQGTGSVAIGYQAGFSAQNVNSIVINATGTFLNSRTANACYINPVRRDTSVGAEPFLMFYNTGTYELTYSTSASTGGKTFIIDHPDDTEMIQGHLKRYLVHACLEGPETGVYYRGRGEVLEGEESTIIKLPVYTRTLASDFTVQVTSIIDKGTYDRKRNIPYKATCVYDNEFVVYGNKGKFNWVVQGSRGSIGGGVEPFKKDNGTTTGSFLKDVEVKGQGPYKWI